MSDNVIAGPWTPRSAPEEYDGLVCDCGSAWFELFMPPSSHRMAGVTVGPEGTVTGYCGFFRCIECRKIQTV